MENIVLFNREFPIQSGDFDKAGDVSTEIKTILKGLEIDREVIRHVVIATYEAEMNVVIHAESTGNVDLKLTPKDILIEITDDGQGIPNVGLAMQEGWSTATDQMREMGFGAGMGLPNIKKNVDCFNIESKVGSGTKLNLVIHHKQP